MVFSGLSQRERMWLFISCHSPSPASVPVSSRTFSQKQQIGSTSFIHASILRFSGVITAPVSLMECELYLSGRSCAIGHVLILLSCFVRQEKDKENRGKETVSTQWWGGKGGIALLTRGFEMGNPFSPPL